MNHLNAYLPTQVKELVTKPSNRTAHGRGATAEGHGIKSLAIRKAQLQQSLETMKQHYQVLLTDMQEL